MEMYNKLKKEILCSLDKSYYVSVEFMSKTFPLKIVIHRQVPIEMLLDRIKFIVIFYNDVLNEKIGKIIINWDCKSLETHIFVEVKDG